MSIESIQFEERVVPSFAPSLNVCALFTRGFVYLVRPGQTDITSGGVKSSDVANQRQGVGKEVRPPLVISSVKAPFKSNVLDVVWSSCSRWLCIVYGTTSSFALSVVQVSGDFDVLRTFVSEGHSSKSTFPVLRLKSFGSAVWGAVGGRGESKSSTCLPAIGTDWTRFLASARPQILSKIQSIDDNSVVTEALQVYTIPTLYVSNGDGDTIVCLDSGLIYSQCTSIPPSQSGIPNGRLISTTNGVFFHRHDTVSNLLFNIAARDQCRSHKSLGLVVHSCLHVSHNLRQILQGWRVASLKLVEELRLVGNISTVDVNTVSVLLDSVMGTVGVTDTLDHIIDYFGLPQIKDPEDPRQADSHTPTELAAYHYHKRLFDTCTSVNEKAVDIDVLSRAVEKLEERFTTILLLFTDQIDTALELARGWCTSLSLPLQSLVPKELSLLREVVSLLKVSISAEFSRLMLLSRYAIMVKSDTCRAASQPKVTREELQPAEQLALVEYLGVLGGVEQVPWIAALSSKMNDSPVAFLYQMDEGAFLKTYDDTMRSLLSDQVAHVAVPSGLVLPVSSHRSCCVVLDADEESGDSNSDDGCGELEKPLNTHHPNTSPQQLLMSLSVGVHGVVLKQQLFDGSQESKDFPVDIDLSGKNVVCFEKAVNDDALLLGAVDTTHLSVWVVELPSMELSEFANGPEIRIPLPAGYSPGDPIHLSLSLSSRMLMCGMAGRMEVIDVDLEEGEE